MSFTASPAFVGIPDFGIIHIDAEQVAKAFQTYLQTASKLTGVALDDIEITVWKMPANPESSTLAELLGCGMRLFDAVVWLTAGRPRTHPLAIDVSKNEGKTPSLHNVARAVFYCYFMLITQARYPASSATKDKPVIPNFLRVIMGMESSQETYVETICSFEPQKFDPAWAKYVSFSGFGRETLSRFGLGVAGYRMFGPFGLYNPTRPLNPTLQKAFDFARTVARAEASWELHPLTRNPNVLTKRGNLNKNLGNLILEVFSEEEIDEMVKAKILYKKPDREPNHRQYTTWEATDDISGTDLIFRSI